MERWRKSVASVFGDAGPDEALAVDAPLGATGRTVTANEPAKNAARRYVCNRIRTTKYTALTFVPKNLFEQFHRFSNCYFLAMVIISLVPETQAVMPQTAALPLVVVLAATAVKDAWEDYKRGRSDRAENARVCAVVTPSGELAVRPWAEVVVGDIVRLVADDAVPADMLILSTSDTKGECRLDTASLDGETNLKVREAHPLTADIGCDSPVGASRLRAEVEAEKPNNNLFRFQGTLNITAGVPDGGVCRAPVAMRHMLLRGCTLRNTEWAMGLVLYAGHDTKILRNDMGSRLKRSRVDITVQRETRYVFVVLVLCCLFAGIMAYFWDKDKRSKMWYISSPFSSGVVGVISFFQFALILQSMVPISLYVTVEMVKVAQAYFIGQDLEMYHAETDSPAVARTSALSEELGQIEYIFSDKTGTLTMNSMVFAGCSIGGTPYALDESFDSEPKAIPVPRAEPFSCAPYADPDFRFSDPSLVRDALDLGKASCVEFFTAVALCHTALVSKSVSRAPSSASSAPVCVADVCTLGVPSEGVVTVEVADEKADNTRDACDTGADVLACTDDPRSPSVRSSRETPVPFEPIRYHAQSPDEAALVAAARDFGVAFLGRTQGSVTVDVRGHETVYTLLNVLEFNSERKRMSVVVRDPNSKRILLLCKGADDVVIPLLHCNESREASPELSRARDTAAVTEGHLRAFARRGLRTLVFAKREVSDELYATWSQEYLDATLAVEDRDAKVDAAAARLEHSLELLGATAVDDQLQAGVPDAVAALGMAGIRLWVLTGDKQETAINIGHACHLLTEDMRVEVVNARDSDECARQLRAIVDRREAAIALLARGCCAKTEGATTGQCCDAAAVEAARGDCDSARNALVIDGMSLQFALSDELRATFIAAADGCASVVCCRCTPVQKAAVVQSVRSAKRAITLAIGDGANDVGMLKAAEIGVGISGKEGMQAVMASDYAVAQFRFLKRLLLVHGRWSYKRITAMVLYFFYKNFVFITVNLWFGFFSGFSGQTVFQFTLLMFYNLAFTSLPPIAFAVLDKDMPAEAAMAMPRLYAEGLNNMCFSRVAFWAAIVDGVYQSIVTFFVPYFALDIGRDGTTGDLWSLGITTFTALVIVANGRLALEVHEWNAIITGLTVGSAALWFFYMLAYMNIMPESNSTFGIVWFLYSNASYWFAVILSVVLALLPVWAQRHFHRDNRPLPSQLVREQIAFGIAPFDGSLDAASLRRPLRCRGDAFKSGGRESPLPVMRTSDSTRARNTGALRSRRASGTQQLELSPIAVRSSVVVAP